MGYVAMITGCSPIMVVIFACIFLRESCGIVDVVTILLSLSGLIMVTKSQPIRQTFNSVNQTFTSSMLGNTTHTEHITNNHSQLMPTIAAFASLFFSSLDVINLRQVKDVHPSTVMFYSWIGMIESTIFIPLTGEFSLPKIIQITSIAIIGTISNLLKVLTLKTVEAGPTAIIRSSSSIIFSFIFQITLFLEYPDTLSIIGTILVFSSILFIGIKKWIQKRMQNSSSSDETTPLTQ
ncbi:Transmembrane protein-like protein [Dinothrombium tinctorium]|uniref:Transmembrane protein-like protein n=1 Tax=Dinothrombium tinctorium TaxID=1965070 RepID=A0A443QCW9_9ACAR|nr:Transmembrane protein-like protein [Dinothrombium tinctorium]